MAHSRRAPYDALGRLASAHLPARAEPTPNFALRCASCYVRTAHKRERTQCDQKVKRPVLHLVLHEQDSMGAHWPTPPMQDDNEQA